jgi:hypothetical protein
MAVNRIVLLVAAVLLITSLQRLQMVDAGTVTLPRR